MRERAARLDLLARTRKDAFRAIDCTQFIGGALRRTTEKILNRILLALPHSVCDEVLRHCDYVELASGQVIYAAAGTVEYAYFINSGLMSLIKAMEDGRSVEIAAAGSEGFLGLFAAYGFGVPFYTARRC